MSQEGLELSCPPGQPLQPLSAFAFAAREMAAHGLAVLPLGGEDGKRPLMKRWSRLKRRLGPQSIDKLAAQHPDANIGIICGLSGLTVVDIDDLAATEEMLARYGDTPIKIATPSGGVHLYYRHQGERCANLRPQGMLVDIKGAGGMVAAPPSVRPGTSLAYRFLEGSWDDLEQLPILLDGGGVAPLAGPGAQHAITPREAGVGERNSTLFRLMLRAVPTCASLDAAFAHARALNAGFATPLADSEVVVVAAKVWQMELKGDNWVGREAHVSMPFAMWTVFDACPDALVLFGHLSVAHAARGTVFAVATKAMAAAGVIGGWKWRRYRRALHWLIQRGFLVIVHQGGRKPGDPSLYKLGPAAGQRVHHTDPI